MSEQQDTPEQVLSGSEQPAEQLAEQEQPDYMTAMQQAHDVHSAAVNTAHETLLERVANAYQIFGSDLDRAYKVWEDASNVIRQSAGIVRSLGGHNGNTGQDPTTAV